MHQRVKFREFELRTPHAKDHLAKDFEAKAVLIREVGRMGYAHKVCPNPLLLWRQVGGSSTKCMEICSKENVRDEVLEFGHGNGILSTPIAFINTVKNA